MRLLALSLLVLALLIFVGTLHRSGTWGFVNAAAEAAMVGALADWFAVTALFRHPLGLPVPHTAIIPERKDALGQSLEEFVVDHFLTEEAARERLAAAEVSRRLGRWLAVPSHATRVASEASGLARRGLAAIREEEVRALVEDALLPRLMKEPISPVAGNLLAGIVDDEAHHGLVDLALVEAHAWLSANGETVARIVGERAPWWSPQWLDDRVIERVQQEVLSWVADVRDDPDHRARRALDDLLAQLARDLQHDPDTMQRAEALKVRVLTHPEIGGTVTAVWGAVRAALMDALDDPEGLLRRRAAAELARLGSRLVAEDSLRGRLDAHVGDAVGFVIRTYGREIAAVISQTVDRWDGKEAAERIELHVGRDLQFIRINGTIVGALVGLAIHTVTVLL